MQRMSCTHFSIDQRFLACLLCSLRVCLSLGRCMHSHAQPELAVLQAPTAMSAWQTSVAEASMRTTRSPLRRKPGRRWVMGQGRAAGICIFCFWSVCLQGVELQPGQGGCVPLLALCISSLPCSLPFLRPARAAGGAALPDSAGNQRHDASQGHWRCRCAILQARSKIQSCLNLGPHRGNPHSANPAPECNWWTESLSLATPCCPHRAAGPISSLQAPRSRCWLWTPGSSCSISQQASTRRPASIQLPCNHHFFQDFS